MRRLLRSIGAAILASLVVVAPLAAFAAPAGSNAAFTHKQSRTIKPKYGDRDVTLWTFCLDKQGDLWCSVSTTPRYQAVTTDGKPLLPKVKEFSGIQVYDAEGQLKAEYPLGFVASAINFAPDGTLFAAGHGKMARISAKGEVLAEGPTPNIGDMEAFKKTVVEQTKKQRAQYAEQYKKQVEMYAKQVKVLEDKADRTEQEDAQLDALKKQQTQMQQIADSFSNQNINPEAAVLNSLNVPGLAATGEHVFVVMSSSGAGGYEVWRTNHELKDGAMVRDGLSGCCGNMDVQARGEGFVTCENTKFQVVSYDQDGKKLASFGRRDRTAPDGFGSCCNPMNCLTLDSGEYVVAESSIGNIKKFDAEGKYVGIVGKARISGGCKHVSLGFDEKLNRYYMMNQDKNHVCVLVPLSEAPAVTEEERMAAEAKAGLGKQLTGHWKLEKPTAPAKPKPKDNALTRLLGLNRPNNNNNTDVEAAFGEDGSATITGGMFANFQASSLSWECVQQSDKVLSIAMYFDGVEFQTLRVKFADPDHLEFVGSAYFPQDKTFVRATDKSAGEPAAVEPAADQPAAEEQAQAEK